MNFTMHFYIILIGSVVYLSFDLLIHLFNKKSGILNVMKHTGAISYLCIVTYYYFFILKIQTTFIQYTDMFYTIIFITVVFFFEIVLLTLSVIKYLKSENIVQDENIYKE